MTSPHAAPGGACGSGTCKCRIASSLSRPLTLLVGDGRSDFCLAGEADLVFAKKSLIAHCRETGISHRPFTEFAEAVSLLEAVLADAPAPATSQALKDKIDG
jgi:2-hydroxy-3-keto-5-methylthiopentenyl-1-phosphate phosphatase